MSLTIIYDCNTDSKWEKLFEQNREVNYRYCIIVINNTDSFRSKLKLAIEVLEKGFSAIEAYEEFFDCAFLSQQKLLHLLPGLEESQIGEPIVLPFELRFQDIEPLMGLNGTALRIQKGEVSFQFFIDGYEEGTEVNLTLPFEAIGC